MVVRNAVKIGKIVAGFANDQQFYKDALVMPNNVVATLQSFMIEKRTGNVTLSYRGGDLRIIKVEETAPAR